MRLADSVMEHAELYAEVDGWVDSLVDDWGVDESDTLDLDGWDDYVDAATDSRPSERRRRC